MQSTASPAPLQGRGPYQVTREKPYLVTEKRSLNKFSSSCTGQHSQHAPCHNDTASGAGRSAPPPAFAPANEALGSPTHQRQARISNGSPQAAAPKAH